MALRQRCLKFTAGASLTKIQGESPDFGLQQFYKTTTLSWCAYCVICPLEMRLHGHRTYTYKCKVNCLILLACILRARTAWAGVDTPAWGMINKSVTIATVTEMLLPWTMEKSNPFITIGWQVIYQPLIQLIICRIDQGTSDQCCTEYSHKD